MNYMIPHALHWLDSEYSMIPSQPLPTCQTMLVFTVADDGCDSWNSETCANHLHLAPNRSPQPPV